MEVSSQAIAQTILEEIAAHERNFFSEDGTTMRALHPYPSGPCLAHIVDAVFWASLMRDEGRPCALALGYAIPGRYPTPGERYVDPLPVDSRTLAKLSPMHDPRSGCLLFRESDTPGERPNVVGFHQLDVGPPGRFVHQRFLIAARRPGALQISWGGVTLLAIEGGVETRLSRSNFVAPNAFIDFVRTYIDAEFAFTAMLLLSYPAKSIAESGHGGSIWVTRSGEDVRGAAIGTRFVHHPAANSDSPFEKLRMVDRFAAADGAVLITSDGTLLGYSTFLTENVAESHPVVSLEPGGGSRNITVKDLGFARHRSSAGFCLHNRPCMAIVCSQDGAVSLLIGSDKLNDLVSVRLPKVGLL